MKWPWQWTAAEYRAFGDWYLGVVANRTTFKVFFGVLFAAGTLLLLFTQCSDPEALCSEAFYWCIRRGGTP